MRLFLKIVLFIVTMIFTVGEVKSSTVVNLSQKETSSFLQEDANGNYIYLAQDGRIYDSVPLPEVTVTASMPGHIQNAQAAAYLGIYSGTEAFMSHPVTIGVSVLVGLPGMVEGIGGLASLGKSLFNVGKGLVRSGRGAREGGNECSFQK